MFIWNVLFTRFLKTGIKFRVLTAISVKRAGLFFSRLSRSLFLLAVLANFISLTPILGNVQATGSLWGTWQVLNWLIWNIFNSIRRVCAGLLLSGVFLSPRAFAVRAVY